MLQDRIIESATDGDGGGGKFLKVYRLKTAKVGPERIVANGVTWGPYKWPKITGGNWGYNSTYKLDAGPTLPGTYRRPFNQHFGKEVFPFVRSISGTNGGTHLYKLYVRLM